LVWVKKFSTHFDRWSKPDKNNTSYYRATEVFFKHPPSRINQKSKAAAAGLIILSR